MADAIYRVELTASFLERLDAIDAFLLEANAGSAFDGLLAELRATVIPNLQRFSRIGRRYLAHPPRSAEAMALLAAFPAGAPDALREYLHGDCLMLFLVVDVSAEAEPSVYLRSIRHHRELSFDFARLWPGICTQDAQRTRLLPASRRLAIHSQAQPGGNDAQPARRLTQAT